MWLIDNYKVLLQASELIIEHTVNDMACGNDLKLWIKLQGKLAKHFVQSKGVFTWLILNIQGLPQCIISLVAPPG